LTSVPVTDDVPLRCIPSTSIPVCRDFSEDEMTGGFFGDFREVVAIIIM
jgi:hypothetical protein